MDELFVVVSLRAREGKEDDLRRDLIAVVAPSRKEAGSLRYDLFVDQSEPGRFLFVEHWASAEDQQKHHNEGPHIKHFNEHGAGNVEKIEFAHFLRRIA